MAIDFCRPYGMMARPPRPETGTGSGGATWLESAVIAAISCKRSLLNSGLASQARPPSLPDIRQAGGRRVWAREYWSSGEKKQKKYFLIPPYPPSILLRRSKRVKS